jgi:hypothetical protein
MYLRPDLERPLIENAEKVFSGSKLTERFSRLRCHSSSNPENCHRRQCNSWSCCSWMACHLDPAMPRAVPDPNGHCCRLMKRSAYCTTHGTRKYWTCLRPRTRLTPEGACGDESGDGNDDADAPLRGIAAGPQACWSFYLRPICE